MLTLTERETLLKLARSSIERAVAGKSLPLIRSEELTPDLAEMGASFVTLTRNDRLRGCIGALEAYQPLAQDVQEHAVDAAMNDYRFPPVRIYEVPDLKIEISRLTKPQPLAYQTPQDLLKLLRPGVDGVVIHDRERRATFLPQVWEQIPSPAAFLDHLCQKMGAPASLWREKALHVLVYQVEEFHEE